ncbi:vacuolar protein sorting 25 [Tieghemostelium lacteum]|uniref:ESCRT-II complex subunit VPS25 n=1 Tax=Tieghemostelium lacteum TaxID=361077 RepID=A0A151ZRY2_TIELA|nr:vacuolar protein sorting 25 [Tieghemostelium lacteum]|eukprot:KYQ96781.1 vacuolar protein sorting 25 [Tieghemostelium lacteum]
MQMWQDLILQYCRFYKKYELDLLECVKSNFNLFYNEKINRRLSIESLKEIFDDIVVNGYAEWIDNNSNVKSSKGHNIDKSRVLIMWRKPEEWASQIYKWVIDNGQVNSILTIWEIQNGDDSKDQEFHQLNTTILLKALKTLEKQQKAQVFSGNENDNLGVKFFSI